MMGKKFRIRHFGVPFSFFLRKIRFDILSVAIGRSHDGQPVIRGLLRWTEKTGKTALIWSESSMGAKVYYLALRHRCLFIYA